MFEKFLHQTPFYRLAISLLAGIIFQIYYPVLKDSIIYILCSLFLIILLFDFFKLNQNYGFNKIWGLLVTLLLFFAGMQLVNLKQQNVSHFNNREYVFIATLVDQAEEKEKSVKTVLKIDFICDSLNWQRNNSLLLCYFQKDSTSLHLNLGDQIIAKSYLNEIAGPGNPYSFNYKRYLSYKEIYTQSYIKTTSFEVIAHDRGSKIRIFSNKTRQKLLSIYQKNKITGDEFAVLSALTLGYKLDLTPELKESFSTSGSMHILAVSGLHVGIIFIILCKLLFFLQKNKYGKKLQSIIIIIVLFFYAFLTGLSDSVLRATIMFSFISLGRMFTRQINIYNSISASAFLLLIINPYSAMNVGFQLSYVAVISIVFFQPKIYSIFTFNNRIFDYPWQLISVAIAAQLGTFPITIYYFDQFPLYFILSNIMIIPVATLIIYGAILLFAFSFSDIISIYISKALFAVTLILNRSVHFIQHLPFSKIDQIQLDFNESLILLLFIFMISFFIVSKKIKFLKSSLYILLILLIYTISSGYLKSQKAIFTVHQIKGTSAIHFIDNNRAYFACNKELDPNNQDLEYQVAPLWKEYGIKDIVFESISDSIHYFTFKNKRIVQIKSNSIRAYIPGQKLEIDYIILSENSKIYIGELSQYFKFDKIIFDSSNSFYKIKRWIKECNQNEISYYDVLSMGAYIEYL